MIIGEFLIEIFDQSNLLVNRGECFHDLKLNDVATHQNREYFSITTASNSADVDTRLERERWREEERKKTNNAPVEFRLKRKCIFVARFVKYNWQNRFFYHAVTINKQEYTLKCIYSHRTITQKVMLTRKVYA